MPRITFSNVAQTFNKYMSKKNMTGITRELLNFFTKSDMVLNEKGEPYEIDPKEYIKFYKGENDIYENIRKGLSYLSILNDIEDNLYTVFDKFVVSGNHQKIAEDLILLVNEDDDMDDELKKEILSIDIDDPYLIVAKIFIYSIGNNNKVSIDVVTTITEVKENVESLIDYLSKLPKPIRIEVPTDLDEKEMIYISAILSVFAEDAGVSVITRDELNNITAYSKYKNKFDRCRKDYYAAESIRESIKETILPDDTDYFNELKDETFNAVIDIVEDTHPNGLTRMNKVMEHVTTVPLSSLIAMIPGWVKASEKKGICHMLIDSGDIWWQNNE